MLLATFVESQLYLSPVVFLYSSSSYNFVGSYLVLMYLNSSGDRLYSSIVFIDLLDVVEIFDGLRDCDNIPP